MKLLHISDLHIGKRVNEFSMIDDQKHVLRQIINIIKEHTVEAVLISGDVYDKTQPSAEAVELLDHFLTDLKNCNCSVFIISGNHDSPERLGFAGKILEKSNIFIAGVFCGNLQSHIISDNFGDLHIHMLPFVKPVVVKSFFDDVKIDTYTDAVNAVISSAQINTNHRNILLAHQFVTSGATQPLLSDSETLSLGGLDNVDANVFEPFDYTALGHIHRPQKIGKETIRYSGSPLKYSFSEVHHKKSAVLINMGKKGDVDFTLIPLSPLRDMREVKGPIDELLRIGTLESGNREDYIHATVTDEDEVYDAIGQLRRVYPNLMVLDFENSKTMKTESTLDVKENIDTKKPDELFSMFYQMQNNTELSSEQQALLENIFEQVGEIEI